MKNIFIMAHSMEIGGAEKALLGILENMDTYNYQVDLFLLRHKGEFMKHIPKKINLLPEHKAYSSLGVPILEAIKKKQFRIVFARYIGKAKAKARTKELNISGNNNISNEYSHKYTFKVLPEISDKEYDLAISFMSPHYFVTHRIKAKKKAAWIHTDYDTFQTDIESEIGMWNQYDYIVSISQDVTKSFLKTFSELREKIVLIENIMPIEYMELLAEEFSVESEMPSDGSIKLLTIGRFTYQKKMEEIPEICKGLRALGLNIKWYLIGYGGSETLIRNKIEENEMEEYVIVLGKKENPYPYIKACDIYVQPSRYEGKSIAVREAQILSKPVVITAYPTAKSQLVDGVDGIVVPMDIQGTIEGIANLIADIRLLKKLSENTKIKDYVNKSEIKKIYGLME